MHLTFSMELKTKAKRQQQIAEIHSVKIGNIFATLGNHIVKHILLFSCPSV